MDKISAIKKRVLQFIDNQSIKKEDFYVKTNIAASNFKGKGLNSDIGGQNIVKILSFYPNISPEWLLIGEGEMLKKQEAPIHIIKESIIKELEETRPRIPMDAAAGSISITADSTTMSQCEQLPIIKAFACYDFTIIAKGDSMEPEYHSGDELACLYIKDTSFVQWGRVYVLDTAQGILVKRIFDAEDSILCKSDNDRYHDFRIHKSELYNIALVIGMLRRY